MATGIFIGTFDPLHGGHIGQLLRAHHAVPLTKVFILINKDTSHKPHASSWQHRLKMAELTLEAFDLPFAYEIAVVKDSLNPEISGPIDYKIIGIDSFISDIDDSSRWDYITKWSLIVLSIPTIDETSLIKAIKSAPDALRQKLNYTYVDKARAPMMNYDFKTKTFSTDRIHATQLRAGKDQTFIPLRVQEYIQTHHLYNS